MSSSLFTSQTPSEMAKLLAERAKALRLGKNLTRKTFAARAGISVASLIRFENTGKASLELVLKVAYTLNRLNEFEALLQPPPARSIGELEARAANPTPKRGRL